MVQEKLNSEWLEYAKKNASAYKDKIDLPRSVQLPAQTFSYKAYQDATLETAQHYQNKVADLIQAKIKNISETENYNETVSVTTTVEIYTQLLTELINLKP